MMAMIIAFAALVVDAGRGYNDRLTLQFVADTSALSGAGRLGGNLNGTMLDLSCAIAAAVNEAVLNLPGTAVPAAYALQAGGSCPSVTGATFSWSTSGMDLHNSYTMDLTANVDSVTVTLHHSLPLTFGVAAGFGPSFQPAATATAVNGGVAFALVLFRNNNTGNSAESNPAFGGSGVTLQIQRDPGAPPNTNASALSNEGICPAPGLIDMSNTGAFYAYVPTWSKFPGACGSSSNILNSVPPGLQSFGSQLVDPAYPEPAAPSGPSKAVTVSLKNATDQTCLAPGTYTAIDVKKGQLVLLPGVFRITGGSANSTNFQVGSSSSVVTADQAVPAYYVANSGCPATPPPYANAGVTVEMAPTGNFGSANQLHLSSGASFSIHAGPENGLAI